MKKYVYGFIILLVLSIAYYGYNVYTNLIKEKEKVKLENRVLKLKNDSIRKIETGYYRRLVADTATKKELKDKIKDLDFQLENREPITLTEYIFIPISKEGDAEVAIKDSIVDIKDFYPEKENPFIEYTNRLNINSKSSESNFKLNPIEIRILLTQKEDGMFEQDIQLPDFLEISKLDIESVPLYNKISNDKGRLFIGVNAGYDFNNNSPYGRGSLMYKINDALYLETGLMTTEMMDIGFKINF